MTSGLFYHDVFRVLRDAKVRYVVVGGIAVNLQGVPRFTADVDVAVALEGDNLHAAATALTALGLQPRLPVFLEQLRDLEVVRGWIADRNLQAFTMQDPANPLRQVDLLISSPVPFDELERTADRLKSADLEIGVASLDALIRMKTGTGREQDRDDIVALERLRGSSGRKR